jgi:hypothetical protein
MSGASPVSQMRGLAASAMIGTDRASDRARSPEELLSRAAILGIQARAGFRPCRYTGHLPVCPVDPRPAAGPGPMAMLMRLLANPDSGLIGEWAELAHCKGVRIADPTVPIVLDWWSRQPNRKEVIFAVCGKRGEWLASLNPGWRKPVAGEDIPPNAEEIWQTGKTPERIGLLLTIRQHDPGRALSMVQSTWGSDGADERRRFVEVLAAGCTMAEEPFFEDALDDKSKVVRRAAAAALSNLPGSRLRKRMNDRATSIIIVEGKRGVLKRGAKVSLRPPPDFDKAWGRDGVEEEAASGKGKRAWWMQQILSAADLSVWMETTGLEPAGVLEALSGDDYIDNALEAIVESVRSRGDAAWVAAILDHRLAGKAPDPAQLGELWTNLKPAEIEPLILRAASHKGFTGAARWELLATAEHPWSGEFCIAALNLLANAAPRKGEAWSLYGPVERLSRVMAPELADRFAETVLAMFPDEPTDSFKRSIDRIRLRADMHKEFAS